MCCSKIPIKAHLLSCSDVDIHAAVIYNNKKYPIMPLDNIKNWLDDISLFRDILSYFSVASININKENGLIYTKCDNRYYEIVYNQKVKL